MTTKRDLDALIDSGDAGALRETAGNGRHKTKLLQRIFARLYSHDPAVKWRAVVAFGVLVAEDVMEEDEAREQLKRLLWILNDESGSVPFGVPEALGEMFANRPSLLPIYRPILVSYLVHKEMIQTGPIRAGVVWALGRVGLEDPEDRQRAVPGLKSALAADEAEVRGAALWTLTRLGMADELRESVEARLDDEDSTTLLIDGEVLDCRLADLAREALDG